MFNMGVDSVQVENKEENGTIGCALSNDLQTFVVALQSGYL